MAVSGIASASCAGKIALVCADHRTTPPVSLQLDQIEAAGILLARVHGADAGAQYLGKRMRKAA